MIEARMRLTIFAVCLTGMLIASAGASSAAQEPECSEFLLHGISPGMPMHKVWKVLGERGAQVMIRDPSGAMRASERYRRGGSILYVEYDGTHVRRSGVVVVRTRAPQASDDPGDLQQSLLDRFGPPASVGSDDEGTVWIDPRCRIRVESRLKEVSEWWRPAPTEFEVELKAAEQASIALPAESEQVPPRRISSSSVPVEFPAHARKAGLAGRVLLEAVVRRDGSVGALKVVEASPPGVGFERAARKVVRRWRYTPARQGGLAVEARIRVVVEFDPESIR